MTYRGRVKNGVVIIEGATALPVGTEVKVEIVAREADQPTLAERLMKYAGALKDLPSDLAQNHDH